MRETFIAMERKKVHLSSLSLFLPLSYFLFLLVSQKNIEVREKKRGRKKKHFLLPVTTGNFGNSEKILEKFENILRKFRGGKIEK